MKNRSGYSLCTRLLCVLLLVCLFAPSAASAAALMAPSNLYDALALQGNTEIYVISEKEFVILVQSPPPSGSQPVNENGLEVTVTTKADYRTKACTKKATTKNGMAIFQVEDFRTEKQRKATRYFYGDVTITDPTNKRQTWHDPEARLIAGQKLKVLQTQSVKEPYVYEASFNDTDVLMSDFKAQITPKNDALHKLRVIISQGQANVSSVTCKLRSGEKVLQTQTIDHKTDGKFTLDFLGQWLHNPSGFAIGKPVTLEFTAGSQTKTFKLGIVAVKPPVDEPQTNMDKTSTFGFSMKDGKLQITFPKKIPFVGEQTVTVTIPTLPITFYLDTTGKLLLGVTFAYSKEPFNEDPTKRGWKKTNAVKVDDWIDEQWKKYTEDRDKIKNKVTPIKGALGSTPWMPKLKLDFCCGVMAKGENIFKRKEANTTLAVSTFASMGATLSVRKYFVIAPIPFPFYIGADVKGSIMAAYDYTVVVNQGDPLKTMKKGSPGTPIDLEGHSFSLSASFGVSVTMGFGIDGIAGIWAEGGVTALPAVTFAKQTEPSKPFPHYEFKLNFYIKAGARLIFVNYEITPISYNYVIADNHDPKKKPYFEKISGPWMPAPTSGDGDEGDGEAYTATATEMTQAELEDICMGSISLDTDTYGDTWDGSDPNTLGMPLVQMTAEQLARLNTLVESNQSPYENDAVPYDDLPSDEVGWTAGTSDGLGAVKPDYHITVLEGAYANPKIKYIEMYGTRYMFFVAAIRIGGNDGVICPTLLCTELTYATNKIDSTKLYAIVYGTESVAHPRYVTDFDVCAAQIKEKKGSGEITFNQFEVVVSYSTVPKPAETDGKMGLFVRPFRWTGEATGPVYLPQRKELDHRFSGYDYKVKALSILLMEGMEEHDVGRDATKFEVCVAYLLQYNYNYDYKKQGWSTPAVLMYTRNYDGNWGDRTRVSDLGFNYPVSQVYVGAGMSKYSNFSRGRKHVQWRISYVYNTDRKSKTLETNYIQSYFYNIDLNTGEASYASESSEMRGYNIRQLTASGMTYIATDGSLRLTSHYDKAEHTLTFPFSLPGEGKSFYTIEGYKINFFYWMEAIKTPTDGTPKPVPTPQPDYKHLMGRMVSVEVKDPWGVVFEFTGNYRTSKPFILCRLDQNVDQLSAYPVPGSYCGLYYTTIDPKTKNTADIHFARVPFVDAIEVPSLTPSDPCIAQGEVFRMYVNIENSGNTFLGRGKVRLVYNKSGQSDVTQENTIDLLDCNKMMATSGEFDYSELADGEIYIVEEEQTLAQALQNAETAKYYDEATFADSSDTGYQSDQVKLKHFVPGERHLYYIDGCKIPASWTGTVKITGNGIGAERRPVWESAYTPYDDNDLLTLTDSEIATGYKAVPEVQGGGYVAYTKGASALAGYSDIVIEGDLLRIDGTDYLELCLRNESTDPSDVVLQIYGDDKLLLDKTFHNVACGAVFDESPSGLAMDTMSQYDNGFVTEGYDPNTSTGKNGYINLTIPVAALTQGEKFYQLTAKLSAAEGVATLESRQSDSQDFIIMQEGFLQLNAEPQDLTLYIGASGSMNASFTGGIAPYSIVWQRLDEDGGWHDVHSLTITTAADASHQTLWDRLFTSASADTIDMYVSMPFRNATDADAGSYRATVTDKSGQWIASDWAKLNVVPPPAPPPKTGDAFPVGLTLALLGLSLIGLTGTIILYRRARAKTR